MRKKYEKFSKKANVIWLEIVLSKNLVEDVTPDVAERNAEDVGQLGAVDRTGAKLKND